RLVAHEATVRRMKAAGVRGVPTTVVTDHVSLFDQPPKVELYYFGRGHTDGDLVVAFPGTDIVHMGDLFPAKAAPVIDAANGGSGQCRDHLPRARALIGRSGSASRAMLCPWPPLDNDWSGPYHGAAYRFSFVVIAIESLVERRA